MADATIDGLPTLASVDRTTDKLAIWDASDSLTAEATINSALGFSAGNPVSTSDSQTLTNKTLTSPTISSPALSGTVTGTYTIGGTPTFPSSVATLTGSQTLTNKTLTSPTINTPTITNPTITVDTISEFTSANGVNIDGLLIKDGLLPAGNIQPLNLQSGTGSSWVWQSWAPTWTNLTVGNGTVAATYAQIGKTVHFKLKFTLGSTSSVGSNPSFTLPVTSVDYNTTTRMVIGELFMYDSGTFYSGAIAWLTTTTADLTVRNASATYTTWGGVTATVPFTWATADAFSTLGTYEAA